MIPLTPRLTTVPEFPEHALYGRHAEQQQMLTFYRGAVVRRPGACMVEGISGIGKSALLAASRRSVCARGALAFSGQFEPPSTAPALHGLVRLLENLTHQMLSLPPTHTLRRALYTAVGASSALFVDLVPSAVRLFGPQLASRLTSLQDYRNSITLLFHQMIQALATPAQPVVWFLDDCQWCDAASAEILRRLLLDTGLQHWCIFAAHRTAEGSQPPTFSVDIAVGSGGGCTDYWAVGPPTWC